MKITFHFLINSRKSQKNSRYFYKKTQEILQKTQGIFQKTQVFANSELEIVAEKRPKKEPAKSILIDFHHRMQKEKKISKCAVENFSWWKERQRVIFCPDGVCSIKLQIDGKSHSNALNRTIQQCKQATDFYLYFYANNALVVWHS